MATGRVSRYRSDRRSTPGKLLTRALRCAEFDSRRPLDAYPRPPVGTQPAVPLAPMQLTSLLVANLLHSAVALLWVATVRRVAGPLSPTAWADLLRLCVGLPPLVALARAAGVAEPPTWLRSLRVDRWVQAYTTSDPLWQRAAGLLLLGSAFLFVVQELRPLWRVQQWRQVRAGKLAPPLSGELRDLVARARADGLAMTRGRVPQVLIAAADSLSAGLIGVVSPQLVVSRGLVAALDAGEMRCVLAHELAHWWRGGNLRLFGLWLLRVLQAANPATLLLFRALIEAEEMACDEWAARLTGQPAALGSALIKVHGVAAPRVDASYFDLARTAVLREADLASTRARVKRLLNGPSHRPASPSMLAAASGCLVLLLWSIA